VIITLILIPLLLLFLYFINQLIDIITAIIIIAIWLTIFAIDAIYTYKNKQYIKSNEFNIILRRLYSKIPYIAIIIMIFAIECLILILLSYLIFDSITIKSIGLIALILIALHIQAIYSSIKFINK